MTWTLEDMFTSPLGFGVDNASPVQRAICRTVRRNGRAIGDLAERSDVCEAFGGRTAIDTIDALPPGESPRKVTICAAIRSGKTFLVCAAAVCATQQVNLNDLKSGEVPRVSIVSLTLDLAHVAHGILVGAIMASPVLRKLVIGEPTADSIMLRHPSGRPVEIKCVAGTRAGYSLIARWSAGVIFDEGTRMVGSDDGAVVALDDMIDAVEGRLLEGAQIFVIGSPAQPFGPVYKQVQNRFGKPGADLVVIRANGPAMNPKHWTPARCERLKKDNPEAYETDVLGNFGKADACPFDVVMTNKSVGRVFGRYTMHSHNMGLDASSGGNDHMIGVLAGFSSTRVSDPRLLVKDKDGRTQYAKDERNNWIIDPEKCPPPMFVVHEIYDFGSHFWRHRSLASIIDELASAAANHGVRVAHGDNRERMGVDAEFSRNRMEFVEHLWSNDTKADAVARLARIIKEDSFAIPDNPLGHQLRDQLIRFRRSYTRTGRPSFEGKTDDMVACCLTLMMADAKGLLTRSPLHHHGGSPPRSSNGMLTGD